MLFEGQTIVTEIISPEPTVGTIAGTTGVAPVARTAAGNVNAGTGDTTKLPLGVGPGFGGTLLTGEMSDGYLILHRIRAGEPVTHEIFHDGSKVGFVTEVASPVGGGRSRGRNSFAFESTDGRFVVHLTQPDGTRIHATTENGRFSGQVVERAAIAALPRSVTLPAAVIAAPPTATIAAPPLELRSPDPQQRLARPQEPTDRIILEERAPVVPELPRTVPLPRAFPKPLLRPAIAAPPVRTASPSPLGLNRNASAPITGAPVAKPKPAIATVGTRPPAAAAARPAAPAATQKSTVAAVSTDAPAARPKPTVASVRAQPPAGAAATTAAPAAKPKPAVATVNAQPRAAAAAKPVARSSRPPGSGVSNP